MRRDRKAVRACPNDGHVRHHYNNTPIQDRFNVIDSQRILILERSTRWYRRSLICLTYRRDDRHHTGPAPASWVTERLSVGNQYVVRGRSVPTVVLVFYIMSRCPSRQPPT